MSDFMKILPVGTELFLADGQVDQATKDEANSRFSQFFERA
jgi:hypothetical protein